MLTIRNVGQNWLILPVIGSYVITFLVIGFVYVHWGAMVRLRKQWYRSPEYLQHFYARTLMCTHVPKKFQSDEGTRWRASIDPEKEGANGVIGIQAIFASVNIPYPTTSVHIGRKVGRLPELIEYHNDAVRELEQVLVRFVALFDSESLLTN
jgi:hypothetical protein